MHYYSIKSIFRKSTCSPLHFFSCALACLFLTTNANAKGVAAGTEIANKAVVSYSIDNTQETPIESTPQGNSLPGIGNGQATKFKVDRKIDLVVTGNNNANVKLGDKQASVTFSLVNEGNATQEFSLNTNSTVTGDDFDSTNCQTSVTQIKDSAGANVTGLSLPLTGNITLDADYQAAITVKCDIPLNNNNQPIQAGGVSQLALTATAVKNQDGTPVEKTSTADDANAVDTVFVDNAGSDDNNQDASHSARRKYIATNSSVAPTLSIKKSIARIQDPKGGNSAVSGAVITYKIKVITSGDGIINDVVITDPTPSGLTYKKGSIYLNNINLTDKEDYDKVRFDGSSKTSIINIGTITAGLQNEILISYTIN